MVRQSVSLPLANWTRQQKERFRDNKLPLNRFEKLHNLGLDWTVISGHSIASFPEGTTKSTTKTQENPPNQPEASVPSVDDREWSDMFEELKQLKHTISGHANAPIVS
jgi:hypothetical protein